MHERIIGLYERNAAAWAEARGDRLVEKAWLDRFTAMLKDGASVLDLGCGSGEPITRYLVDIGFRVTGVDSSPSLIAMCRNRFPEQEWLVGDMRELALGRRFDGVLAWHSFFHLHPDDQRTMFARFAAHAAPGAILMFTSGDILGEAIGEWQGEPLYHGSLAPDEYEERLAETGFRVVERRLNDAECGGATVWLAQMSPPSGLDGSA